MIVAEMYEPQHIEGVACGAVDLEGETFSFRKPCQFAFFRARLVESLFTAVAPGVDDVADALLETVTQPATMGTVEVAGPEVYEMVDFVRDATGRQADSGDIVADVDSEYFGGRISRDALLPRKDHRTAPTLLTEWLRHSR